MDGPESEPERAPAEPERRPERPEPAPRPRVLTNPNIQLIAPLTATTTTTPPTMTTALPTIGPTIAGAPTTPPPSGATPPTTMPPTTSAVKSAPAPASATTTQPLPLAPAQAPLFAPLWHEWARTPRADLLAGSVVFLVALPLCLGIAVACHAPPIAGIIAGICGGLIVPLISHARLAVSGPAAGLTAIVIAGIAELGSFEAFLTAVFLSGALQALFGVLRTGAIATVVPSNVIRAMLSAIGVILVVGQISILLGVPAKMIDFDKLVLSAARGAHITAVVDAVNPGAVLIAAVSLLIIATWQKNPLSKVSWMSSSLVVVVAGTLAAVVFNRFVPQLALPDNLLIHLPNVFDEDATFAHPEWHALRASKTWTVAVTIALVASIETLLSVEALDRLDPERRRTPKDRELVAQGMANMASGILGGLPVTGVVVRGSTNIQAGAKSQLSALIHGLLLVVSVLALAPVLDHVPTACLAAILFYVGLKLVSPAMLRDQLAAMLMHLGDKMSHSGVLRGQIRIGFETWVAFLVTLVAVVATDLLRGVLFGFLVSILVVLKTATRDTVVMKRDGKTVYVDFLRDGTFLVKPALVAILDDVQDGEHVVFDCTNEFIDPDVREVITAFIADAPPRGVTVEVRGIELDGVQVGTH